MLASLEAVATDDDGPSEAPEQPAAPTHTPDAPATPPNPAETPPPAAGETRLSKLQAKLLADRQAREQKAQQEQQATRATQLEAELAAAKGKPSYEAFVEEFKRDPVATAKKVGIPPRQLLELLTNDALAPGSVAAAATAADAESKGQKALDAIEQMRREQAAREEVAAGNRNNLEFLQATSDTAKYPRTAALDNETRLEFAMNEWRKLAADGHAYDRDLLAELVEARLDKLASTWAPTAAGTPPLPAAAQTAPSSPTSATPASHAAMKQPPKTITPALAGGSSGTARRQTPKERREALLNSLVPVETD